MAEITSMSAFLKENALQKKEVEYIASKRFVGADKKPIPWILRPLTNQELEKITDKHTKNVQVKGTREYQKETNEKAINMEVTLTSVVAPNLNDEQLQASYGVIGAEALLKEMLTPGELADLMMATLEASDFKVGMANQIKSVKNS